MANVTTNPPWKDYPNLETLVTALSLNNIENALNFAATGLDGHETRINDLETGKASTTHAATHAVGGSDPVSPESIGAASEDDPRLYDSGWRLLSTEVGPDVVSGRVLIRRVGVQVFIRFDDVLLAEGSGVAYILDATMPPGFRPWETERAFGFIGLRTSATSYQRMCVFTRSLIWAMEGVRPTLGLSGTFSILCEDAIPPTLPGTPA